MCIDHGRQITELYGSGGRADVRIASVADHSRRQVVRFRFGAVTIIGAGKLSSELLLVLEHMASILTMIWGTVEIVRDTGCLRKLSGQEFGNINIQITIDRWMEYGY